LNKSIYILEEIFSKRGFFTEPSSEIMDNVNLRRVPGYSSRRIMGSKAFAKENSRLLLDF